MKGNIQKFIGVVLWLLLFLILFNMMLDNTTDMTKGLVGFGYCILLFGLGFLSHRFIHNMILKSGINVVLVFFFVFFLNKVLIIQISYYILVFGTIASSILDIRRVSEGKDRMQKLLKLTLMYFVILFSLFQIFDVKWFAHNQMKHEVRTYIDETEKLKDYQIKSIYANTADGPTFAVVTFRQEPEKEYVFVDAGNRVELSLVRKKRFP
ncbi:hypothetical protein GCM10008967_28620 [Bacillus carboniphilus]|uniref:Uncharacterized protein n=1 Tax=Bacillus carboniphilus TaxID=86663 RepID=A0ABN0WG54_9BACI